MTTPSWIDEFEAALGGEFGHGPRVGALATVDEGPSARVRFVVCRRVDPDGTLWVASDARSAKNAQLRRQAEAEVAFWLPGRREQYRLAGAVTILGAAEALDLWLGLSDSARALFAWPEPGTPRDPDPSSFPAKLDAAGPPSASFEALGLRPTRVGHLDLKPHPHRRRRWESADAWVERTLNP